jgi:hypothetical protein
MDCVKDKAGRAHLKPSERVTHELDRREASIKSKAKLVNNNSSRDKRESEIGLNLCFLAPIY